MYIHMYSEALEGYFDVNVQLIRICHIVSFDKEMNHVVLRVSRILISGASLFSLLRFSWELYYPPLPASDWSRQVT